MAWRTSRHFTVADGARGVRLLGLSLINGAAVRGADDDGGGQAKSERGGCVWIGKDARMFGMRAPPPECIAHLMFHDH